MNNPEQAPRRGRGRPRAFNEADVVAQAATLFWAHGYEGCSIGDITTKTGVSAQSIYAAFESKQRLYNRCLEWYATAIGAEANAALEHPNIDQAIAGFLQATADQFTQPDHPRGCMVASAEIGVGADISAIAEELTRRRNLRLAHIRERLERAVVDGQFDAEAVSVTSRFLATTVQGLSVQARDGATRTDLRAVAQFASKSIGQALTL